MEQNLTNQQITENAQMPPKPDNNLILAIITTLCCCLPFGIVAIIKAAKVNGYYIAGQYDEAIRTAADAKKWSIIGIAIGLTVNIIYFLFYFFVGLEKVMQM